MVSTGILCCEIKINIRKNGYSFKEIDHPTPNSATQESGKYKYKYELLGYVCEINHQSDIVSGAHNLVAFIKVNNNGGWYLFNDFWLCLYRKKIFDLQPSWKNPLL